MLSFDEAIALLAENVRPLGTESVPLEQSAGRILAEDLRARSDAPRSDVSVMDGYAVRLDSLGETDSLEVVGEARPGAPFEGSLGKGEAIRIFTGAAIPSGADCVIMQEYARAEGNVVSFSPGHGPERHIRTAGSDFRAGDVILERGTHLAPPIIVPASAADQATVMVAKRPEIAIIATGDELVSPGRAFAIDSAVPDSISYAVASLCKVGGAQVISRVRSPDELAELTKHACEAVAMADCIVVTGGASVGERDFARPMFADTGMDLIFSKLAIKPGRPVWFGLAGAKPVLGLPGNPTSAMVTARLFLRPLLARLQGGPVEKELNFVPVRLASPLQSSGKRETFVRASSTAEGLVPVGNQQSGAQSPLAVADWLIRIPPGSNAYTAGAFVKALAL